MPPAPAPWRGNPYKNIDIVIMLYNYRIVLNNLSKTATALCTTDHRSTESDFSALQSPVSRLVAASLHFLARGRGCSMVRL